MTRERLYLFDTTLRDGQQTQGVDFSVKDKIRITQALDDLGLDYIEGGWARRQSDRQRVLCQGSPDPRPVPRLWHDQTCGTVGGE